MDTCFGRPCKILLAIVARADLFTLKGMDNDTLSIVSLIENTQTNGQTTHDTDKEHKRPMLLRVEGPEPLHQRTRQLPPRTNLAGHLPRITDLQSQTANRGQTNHPLKVGIELFTQPH